MEAVDVTEHPKEAAELVNNETTDMQVPLKKRARVSTDAGAERQIPVVINENAEEIERSILISYLSKRSLEHLAEQVKLLIRPVGSKPDKRSEERGYSVHYSYGDLEFTSRTALADYISNFNASAENSDTLRQEHFKKAMTVLSLVTLPVTRDGIQVVSLGSLQRSPKFHNESHIYPLGYNCKQSIEISDPNSDSTTQHMVECKILRAPDSDVPLFRIEDKSTGKIISDKSEQVAWKLLFGDRMPKRVSFFNDSVCSLLEGLDGLLELCPQYEFLSEWQQNLNANGGQIKVRMLLC